MEKLGEWPFEIGLWVGKGATPTSWARQLQRLGPAQKTIAFLNDDRKPSPIRSKNAVVRHEVQKELVQALAELR